MNNFEHQLSASSKRLASKQMSSLTPVSRPQFRKRISAAWYTTPAAAVAGLLFGLFIQFKSAPDELPAQTLAVVHDTIVQQVHDTIRIQEIPPVNLAKSTTGKSLKYNGINIKEDGIEYNKLIVCAY